ncbi:hypothetical protein J1N35_019226 [Gossypium stocksii]|uniref:Uncharacterized protein n=1 Tax=Gossypium stocksii TaxID=47602 RepID=A0A9D3VQZ9_9ROSI|nr:hypothetical protein J1N35_019226 [Gossypium stocksii]
MTARSSKGMLLALDGKVAKLNGSMCDIEELKGELNICKVALGNGVFVVASNPKADVPKPKEFIETRPRKDVDNLLWGMEQYFHAKGIMDDATKMSLSLGKSKSWNTDE